MRVLVTGAHGWTAKSIIEALVKAGHDISGLDLPGTQPLVDSLVTGTYQGSVSDYDFILNATKNKDVIVHLAVAINGAYETPEIPFNVNVRGTANIFAAALENKIERIVLMSSAPFHVNFAGKLHAVNDRIQGSDGDFMYDLTKCLQEDIASYYAKTQGLTAITLRAGHIVDGRTGLDPAGRSLTSIQYGRGAWICRYDLARAVVKAITYDVEGYDAFHIIGAIDAKQRFDIERTEEIFGFVPEIQFEAYR